MFLESIVLLEREKDVCGYRGVFFLIDDVVG